MAGSIIYWLYNSICVIVFTNIGIVALRRDKPMWFWAGSEDEVEKETYTDIRSFNRKNAIMWFTYAIIILMVSIIGMFISEVIFLFLYLSAIIGGMITMMLYYSYIHNQYTK